MMQLRAKMISANVCDPVNGKLVEDDDGGVVDVAAGSAWARTVVEV
jgi:hypothetical protein